MLRMAQDVEQRRVRFARRAQHASVEAVREHRTRARPQRVERSRDAHEQALHPARQSHAISRFAGQMQVVGEDRVLRQPKPEALRATRKRTLEHDARSLATQVRQSGAQAHGDVDGIPRRVLRSNTMRHTRALALRPAPGVRPQPAPRAEVDRVLSNAPLAPNYCRALRTHDLVGQRSLAPDLRKTRDA